MKKFISGLLVGVLLFAGTSVFADSAKSLLGKRVQGTYEVAFNGKKIGDAAVIEGSTYLPVRSISDAAGIDIAVEGKKISLTTNGGQVIPETNDSTVDEANRAKAKIENEISGLKMQISFYERDIKIEKEEILAPLQERLAELKSAPATQTEKEKIETIEKKIADSQKLIDELQAKIDAAEAEIKQLEAQLNK